MRLPELGFLEQLEVIVIFREAREGMWVRCGSVRLALGVDDWEEKGWSESGSDEMIHLVGAGADEKQKVGLEVGAASTRMPL